MPLDGICMQAVAEELRPELLGLRRKEGDNGAEE